MADILVGFLERDYAKVADVFFAAGFLPPDADRNGLRPGDPLDRRADPGIAPGGDLLRRLMGQLLAVADTFAMQTQPQLLLLQRTMVVAEGVGRLLNPRINMWQLAQPLVEDWIMANLGPRARIQQALAEGLDTARRLPALVRRLEETLERDQGRVQAEKRPAFPWGWLWPLLIGLGIGLAMA
jgi:ubiquinone biosynthesis protein